MGFQFSGLTAHRDGVALSVELTGTLPNPCHKVTQHSAHVDQSGKITVTLDWQDKGGICAQVIVRVKERMGIGRMAPGQSPYVIVSNGQTIAQGTLAH